MTIVVLSLFLNVFLNCTSRKFKLHHTSFSFSVTRLHDDWLRIGLLLLKPRLLLPSLLCFLCLLDLVAHVFRIDQILRISRQLQCILVHVSLLEIFLDLLQGQLLPQIVLRLGVRRQSLLDLCLQQGVVRVLSVILACEQHLRQVLFHAVA